MTTEVGGLAPERVVYAYDARGHGRSVRPPALTMADHVADAVAVADAFELSWMVVLGTSMGSYIAQLATAPLAPRLAGLILVVPRGQAATSATAKVMAAHPELFEGRTAAEVSDTLRELAMSPRAPAAVRLEVAARARALARPELLLSPDAHAAASAALAGFDARAQLAAITCPTLVVSGSDDPLNPPEEGRLVAAAVPAARYREVGGAGHLLSQEQPHEYLGLVREFLAGLPLRPPGDP